MKPDQIACGPSSGPVTPFATAPQGGNSRPPISFPLAASVITCFTALCLSYFSPIAVVLLGLYLASLIFPFRFERNSPNVWAIRIFGMGIVAALAKTISGQQSLFDSSGFVTGGLLAGFEIVLQGWSKPPKNARFEPLLVLLTAFVFLVANNAQNPWNWYLSPAYMAFALLAMLDVRPRARGFNWPSGIWNTLMIASAVGGGLFLHELLWANRGSVMALGARIIAASQYRSRGGLSGTSELGSGPFDPKASVTRMLRIDGGLSDPHLRLAAFETYDEGVWGPSLRKRQSSAAIEGQEHATAYGPFVHVTLLTWTGGVLFFPLNASALVPPNGSSFDWTRNIGPVSTEDSMPYSYDFVGALVPPQQDKPAFSQGPLCVPPTADERERLLTVPSGVDFRVVLLGRRIARAGRTPWEKTKLITDYLLTHYQYSLNFQRGREDPVSDFLLNGRPAHCQYFASAAVMLLRSVGIPARYVTGYYANESDGPHSMVVRSRDAHAWAEAYLDGTGWVTVEATPPAGRADPNVSPLPWYQKTLEKIQDAFSNLRAAISDLTPLQMVEIICGFGAIWALERFRLSLKRRNRPATGPVPPLELRPYAERFESALARRKLALPPAQPWSEAIPPEFEAAGRFVDAYNRARFSDPEAGAPVRAATLQELDDLLSAVESEVAGKRN